MEVNSLDEHPSRLRLLALHGRGSNREITRVQLHNLGLSESDYEIVCLDGPIQEDSPGPGVEVLVSGPWYSWLPSVGESVNGHGETLLDAISDSIGRVLDTVEKEGPFDAIFGFSQGALIASLVNELQQDRALQSTLIARFGERIKSAIPDAPLFDTAIFACSAGPLPISQLRLILGLGAIETPSKFSSIHLIGREDSFKPWSEALANSTFPPMTNVIYLPNGHEINLLTSDGEHISRQLKECLGAGRQGGADMAVPAESVDWIASSELSHRAIAKNRQVADVRLKLEGQPETILDLIERRPREAPLFRQARERDAGVFTSYGDMLAFCQPGGEGDLRRIGVKAGDVVAYVAPPGGSAVSACAFLSIACQACSVPLSANLSETDARLALEQFDVRHLVVFQDIAAPGIEAAFAQYSNESGAQLHFADYLDSASPGLFRYRDPIEGFNSLPVLNSSGDADSLLLRTSGTTSVPKVVPQRQRNLVLNSVILADSIGIHADDVTYSVMPLDHIGGLSASLLCSVAVGASITCDGIYNPESMVEALAESNPRPTWYSAVPTIHNGTVRYLHENSDRYLDQSGQWTGHNLRFIRSGAAALKEPDRLKLQSTFASPVVATYSMSELMPISQPPLQSDSWQIEPGAVGVPITASLAVVDPVSLVPLPFGQEGEVAISGETLFPGYQNNDEANNRSRFLMRSPQEDVYRSWFLTGDLGQMDQGGMLTLKGRIKELIKRGGEQIAPAEVETLLAGHPNVDLAVCFSVPSDIYGEEVGCALVLKPAYSGEKSTQEIVRDMRALLRESGLAPYKVPSCWKMAINDDIPRTASKKIIRNKLASELDVAPGVSATIAYLANNRSSGDKKEDRFAESATYSNGSGSAAAAAVSDKPRVDWNTLAGFRFLLACYVMFMHIGSNDSWDAFSNLRQFP